MNWQHELQRQMDEVASMVDWDLRIIDQRVQLSNRGRGPGWCIWTLTRCGLAFEVPISDDTEAGNAGMMLH